MELEEKPLDTRYEFNGKIINVRVDTVKLPNGNMSHREIVEHNGGICVLPIDEDDNVYFVKQWRAPYLQVVLEIPAGKREGDEDPFEAGKRELSEEIGAKAEDYIFLGKLYPSPGYCGEIIWIYLATNLQFEAQHLDNDEFLNVVKMPFSKAIEMVMNNEIFDSKTQVALLKAKVLLEK